MQRKRSIWPVFLVVILIASIILFLSASGKLKFLSFLEKPVSAVQSFSYNLLQRVTGAESQRIKELENERLELLSRVADFEKLKKENAALSDQFQTSHPQSVRLLPAKVIGAPGFVPGVSVPNFLILDKGAKDNVKVGLAVVIKNNLVGIISKVSENLSRVDILNNSNLSFTAKTENAAYGVVKGGDTLTIDNILLSENVAKEELVLTKGDLENNGIGIPADLIVGKIASVEKHPSDLFQKAEIRSFIDFRKLSTVFVYVSAQ